MDRAIEILENDMVHAGADATKYTYAEYCLFPCSRTAHATSDDPRLLVQI